MLAVSLVGLYLFSSGISWAVFSFINAPVARIDIGDLDSARAQIAELPKTESCPINGKLYSEPERMIWETRRPIAAIIENNSESRPLEGIHKADVVYEAVAEGGVTRFLSIFYCGVAAENLRIAPIRSARIYFVDWAAEYGNNPLFVHVGGANNFCGECPNKEKPPGQSDRRVRAIEELVKLGWRVPRGNDFDTTYDSGFPVFYRDPERLGRPIATEHTMVSETDAIYDQAEARGFEYESSIGVAWDSTFTQWKFKNDEPSSSPQATNIKFGFWRNRPAYNVQWRYDAETNSYLRYNGGERQLDLSTGVQVSAKNVVVQFVDEEGPVDSELHMYYEVYETGDALIFQDGRVTRGNWKKDAQRSKTIFYDADGDEIEFVRGEIWISAVPSGNVIEY